MEAIPSFQSNPQFKRTIKSINKNLKLTTKSTIKNKPRNDPVHFHDVPYVMDYTSWLEKSIDPSIQLAVKGPLSQLCYFFKKGDNGETSITTRPFASPPDALVPIILPDYSSEYYKNRRKNDTGKDNSDDEVPIVNDIYHSNNLEESQQEESQQFNKYDHNNNNALGLKAFYLVNTEHQLDFRISEGVLKCLLHQTASGLNAT